MFIKLLQYHVHVHVGAVNVLFGWICAQYKCIYYYWIIIMIKIIIIIIIIIAHYITLLPRL